MKWLSVRRPMTISDIEQVERDLSIRFPSDYKETIGAINGGALKDSYVEVPGVGSVPYTRNVSLSKDAPASIYSLLPALNKGVTTLFPFAGVGNGDYFCFDLQNNTVILWMHETDDIFSVCDTFTQLLDHIVCPQE